MKPIIVYIRKWEKIRLNEKISKNKLKNKYTPKPHSPMATIFLSEVSESAAPTCLPIN
jgi:hypothetical protein